jgi:hypothetical protein
MQVLREALGKIKRSFVATKGILMMWHCSLFKHLALYLSLAVISIFHLILAALVSNLVCLSFWALYSLVLYLYEVGILCFCTLIISLFSEIREKHKLELENLTLTKHPFRTLHFFMLAMLQYLQRLATYIMSKGALFLVLIVLVVIPGVTLLVTDGLHKKVCIYITCEEQLYIWLILLWVNLCNSTI